MAPFECFLTFWVVDIYAHVLHLTIKHALGKESHVVHKICWGVRMISVSRLIRAIRELCKAVNPLVTLRLRYCCISAALLNQFNTVLVWCIHYCASARTSDTLVMC